MAPKREQKPPSRFMPYLPPGASRRERELQNAEVRSVAASSATRLSILQAEAERKAAAASTTQRSEPAEFREDVFTLTSIAQQSLGGPARDPTTPFPYADVNDRLLIDQYIRVLLLETAPVYALFDVSNVRNVFFLRLLQDQDFYHIGMALCSVKLGKSGASDSPEQMRLGYEFIGRGIAALRERISKARQSDDDKTIMITTYLAELASLTSDYEAHNIHRNSLQEMLTSRGGLENLRIEEAMKFTLLEMKSDWIFRGSSTRQQLDFLEDNTIRPTLSGSSASLGELRDITRLLPEGFRAIIIQRQLSVRTINVIYRSTHIETPNLTTPDQIEAQIQLELQPKTFLDYIEALPAIGQVPEASNLQPATINDLTIVAVFLFVCANFGSDRNKVSSLLFYHFEYFRNLLSIELLRLNVQSITALSSIESEQRQIKSWLTWVLAIALDSWAAGATEFQPAGFELVNRLRELTTNVDDFADLDRLLREYLYSDSLRSSLEVCWNIIQSGSGH